MLANSINGNFNTDFLYLSYFDKYRSGVDYPIFGGSKNFSGIEENYNVTDGTITYNDIVYPSKVFQMKTDGDIWYNENTLKYCKTLSLEMVIKCDSDRISFVWLYSYFYFIELAIEFDYPQNSVNLVFKYDNILSATITTSLPKFSHTDDGYERYKIEDFNSKPHHIAFVFNKEQNCIKLYYDGNKIATINKFYGFQFFNISPRYTSSTLAIAQLAVWNGDKSTDGGNKYTLPSKPYVNIANKEVFLNNVKYKNSFEKVENESYFNSSFKDSVVLPNGFDKLDYIVASSMTNYNNPRLLITDYVLNDNFGCIYASWKITDINNAYAGIFGTPYINETTNTTRCIVYGSSTTDVLFNVDSRASSSTPKSNCSGIALYSDRTQRGLDSIAKTNLLNNQGSPNPDKRFTLLSPSAKIRLFFVFVADENNNITFTGIPCKHGSEYGIYDLVANRFYTNPVLTGA